MRAEQDHFKGLILMTGNADGSNKAENGGQGRQTGPDPITSPVRLVQALTMDHASSLAPVAECSKPPQESAATGYLHRGYAESLAEFGTPRQLPACGGWLLERRIRDVDARDAMGCYPVFVCRHWKKLSADLAGLSRRLVTLVLVTDPFAELEQADLESCFDLVRPFKRHYIADLTSPLADFVNKHHRYYTRRAQRELDIEVCEEPLRYAREWIGLYNHLVRTHHIRGIRAFSASCFQRQLGVPGMVLILARRHQQIVGAHCVARHEDVAYSHLAASSALGYQLGAAYAIYWTTLDYLAARGVRYLDLGGVAGLEDVPADGLSRFKRGWSNATRFVYLCGRVLDPYAYGRICRRQGGGDTEYFPAYRAGEFH